MKRFFLTLSISLFALGLSAQSVEIMPTYGYQFGGKIRGGFGDFRVESSGAYGVNMDISTDNLPVTISAFWLRQDSYGIYQRFGQREERLWGLAAEYFQVGITRQFGNGVAIPFTTFTLGGANFSPKTGDFSDEFRFAATFGGGVKIMPSDKFGIRLHVRMLAPFQWGGAGMWCGNSGCSVNASASTSFIQGEAGGGVILKLN
ncbi:MAG: hypothetical protein RIF33_25310 [Cyclobacteriaceae bacterium]